MLKRTCLILIQSHKGLKATIFQLGLKSCEMTYTQVFEGTCTSEEGIVAILKDMQETFKSLQIACPKDVRLCLIPETTLFREWTFPFRAKSKINQALNLLLDAEFPIAAEDLEHRMYTNNALSMDKNSHLVTVSCAKSAIDMWEGAFSKAEIYPTLITFEPFPLLYALPKSQEIQLILHIHSEHSVVSLVSKGRIHRVRFIPQGIKGIGEQEQEGKETNMAIKALCRDISIVLEGLPIKATQAVFFGDSFAKEGGEQIAQDLGESLQLPFVILGKDIPYSKATFYEGETSMTRLLSLGLAQIPRLAISLPANVGTRAQSRLPAFQRQSRPQAHSALSRYHKYIPALSVASLVFVCYLFNVWAEGRFLHKEADLYRRETLAAFKKAAPDARSNMTSLQMRSVLLGRINQDDNSSARAALFILQSIKSLHTATPNTVALRISRISFERNRCQIAGIAGSFEQVESLRQALSQEDRIEEVQILRATALEKPIDLPLVASSSAGEQKEGQANSQTGSQVAFDLSIRFLEEGNE